MLRVGIDAIEVERVARLSMRFGRERLMRLFTERELDYAFSSPRHCHRRLAVRLAAKEAFVKAWGTPVPLHALEVVKHAGVPFLKYREKEYPLSLTHTTELAVAITVWEA